MDGQTECDLSKQWNRIQSQKKNEALVHATMWMNLENILSERRQTQEVIYCRTESFEKVRRGKCIQKESRLVTPRGCGEGGIEDICLMDPGFPVGAMGTSGTLQWWWMCYTANVRNATGLYATKWLKILYVSWHNKKGKAIENFSIYIILKNLQTEFPNE